MERTVAIAAVVAAVALACAGCDRTPAPDRQPARAAPAVEPRPETPRVTLVDLSTSLGAAREAFNARKGEARFLTLLSPT